ncbi:MAG: oligopeptide/dipeptide ABC transporter ATP-binding protein, partial [Desulfotignum sp.]
LLNSIPVLKHDSQARLTEIPGMVPNLLRMPEGCSFHPRCSQAMDICTKKSPSMVHFAENRRAACWRVSDE